MVTARLLPALFLAVAALPGCGGEPSSSVDPPTRQATSAVPTTTPGQAWTTVPEVELGWPVERAVRRLARAGLVGEPPEVDWPHYAIGTEPAAGSRVRVGSTVRILPGDG